MKAFLININDASQGQIGCDAEKFPWTSSSFFLFFLVDSSFLVLVGFSEHFLQRTTPIKIFQRWVCFYYAMQ